LGFYQKEAILSLLFEIKFGSGVKKAWPYWGDFRKLDFLPHFERRLVGLAQFVEFWRGPKKENLLRIRKKAEGGKTSNIRGERGPPRGLPFPHSLSPLASICNYRRELREHPRGTEGQPAH